MKASVIDIDRPDHPALRGPGCDKMMTRGLIFGIFAGGAIGALYGGSKAIKYGLPRREMVDIVIKNFTLCGVPVGLLLSAVQYLRC